MKKVVFTFGRMNPPTIGHEKLVNKLKSVASKEKADARLYLSHTSKPGSDPLSYNDKIKFAQKAFGIAYKSSAKQIFQIAKEFQGEGYTDVIMVVGSDRVTEFDTLLNKYNGKGDYDFDSIKVVSAGQRDPDAEGVEGMSGTKLRNLAKDGDMKTFMSGLASGLSATDKKKIYALVSKNMKEAYYDIEMDNILMEDSLNENTLTVHKKEQERLAKMRSSTTEDISEEAEISLRNKAAQSGIMYNTIKEVYNRGISAWSEGGSMSAEQCAFSRVNSFITGGRSATLDADLMERNYRKEYDNYQGRPEQIARRASRNQARKVMGDKAVVGLDVGHKDNNPLNNTPANLRNEDPSDNRREPRLREVDDKRKDDPCWDNYKQVGMKKKGGKQVPNCVPEDIEIDEAFPVQVTVKDKKGKTHTTGTIDLRGATHALLIHYKEIPPVKGDLPGSKETKPSKTEIWLGTEGELAKTAKRMLKQHPSKKYATGAEVVKLDQKMVKGATLDEAWFKDIKAKISQLTHPKGWDEILQKYADGMKDSEHSKHPSAWAADVAKEYNDINTRQLIKYINNLVKQGKLPKELNADMQRESFSDFVAKNNKERDT